MLLNDVCCCACDRHFFVTIRESLHDEFFYPCQLLACCVDLLGWEGEGVHEVADFQDELRL